jgi:hypothetical protein
MKAYFLGIESVLMTGTDHTSSNIISRQLGLSGVGPGERKIRANHFSDLPVASVDNFVFG